MSVIGIVCEFNPFHNGHKYLIDAVRKDGDTVVCVMSGNFTQRAEPALFEKRYRVISALKNGADIVLELPFVYATGTAEIFAKNAVKILCEFGCDKIAFGMENADGDTLIKAADTVADESFEKNVEKQLKNDISYPAARELAFKQYGIDFDLNKPNNILALEYVKELRKNYPDVGIIPVERKSVEHDSNISVGHFASASLIRDLFGKGEDIKRFIPENAGDCLDECEINGEYMLKDSYSICLQTVLRNKLGEDDGDIAYMTEELSNRIENALKASKSLDELFDSAKTKRYTHSRVRRAVLSKAFGVRESDIKISAPYIRLLGFNRCAEAILGEKSKSSKLPVISSYKQLLALDSDDARRIAELGIKASDFYNLVLKSPKPCSAEMTRQVIKI